MTIAVRDKNTNKIIAQANTNDWAEMYVSYISDYRRKYSNAVVEVYYTQRKLKEIQSASTTPSAKKIKNF